MSDERLIHTDTTRIAPLSMCHQRVARRDARRDMPLSLQTGGQHSDRSLNCLRRRSCNAMAWAMPCWPLRPACLV
eukprot:scaffold568749_cov33-Prasinocladus_malaysianus.AAC.2